MSRHGKRLSVFDRLGPGNDEELTPPHSTSSTSGSRHRHYSTEKHDRSHLTLSSDKRINDVQGERSRKHRDDVEPVSAKREKVNPTLRKDMKLIKPSLRGSSGGIREEQTDEQIRSSSKRKRERESLSDSEGHYRETKRSKIETSLERHHSHKDSKLDTMSYIKKQKHGDTSCDTEQHNKSEIDWSILSTIPCPKPTLKMTSLERHRSGPIFADTGVSLSLAGPTLAQKVSDSVRQHLQNHHHDTHELLDEPFGGYSLAGLGASHLRSGINSYKQFELGACRRALTAGVDFMMRKKCLQKFDPKGNEFAGCFVPYYTASLKLYENL